MGTDENHNGRGEMPIEIPEVLQTWADVYGYDASTTQLRSLIVAECASNMFKALMGEVGPNRTIDAIRPLNNIIGRVLVNMAKQRFGELGTGVEAVTMPYYWLHCGSSHGRINPMEIREGKAIVELFACPFAAVNAPPEACVAMSHAISEGLCEASDPSYEYIWTHHLANGDGRCRYVVKKKSSKYDPSHLGRLEKTVPLELSQSEMDLATQNVAFTQLNNFTTASVNTIGSQRTIELVTPLAIETGHRLGVNLIKASEEAKNDFQGTRNVLELLNNILLQNGPPSRIIVSEIEKEIVDCPFKGSSPEVCKNLEGMFNGVCEAINPDYEFAYDRMMSKGDSTCHWTIRKNEMPKERPSSEDPTKNLALRLSKGEISLEEFERTIASLRKHGLVK